MRLTLALLGIALLAAGCISAPEPEERRDATAATPTATPTNTLGPTTVYDETIDFSQDTSGGVVNEVDLVIPAGARSMTFTANFTAATPTATTKDVRIWLVDGNGDIIADCDLGTNAVTTAEARDCGPSTNNVKDTTYQLRWRGFGNLQASVVVTVQ